MGRHGELHVAGGRGTAARRVGAARQRAADESREQEDRVADKRLHRRGKTVAGPGGASATLSPSRKRHVQTRDARQVFSMPMPSCACCPLTGVVSQVSPSVWITTPFIVLGVPSDEPATTTIRSPGAATFFSGTSRSTISTSVAMSLGGFIGCA